MSLAFDRARGVPRAAARLGAGLSIVALAVSACTRREPPEVVLDRSRAAHLTQQIAGLKETIAKAERGELSTTDLIAIGASEELAGKLLNAPLPLETVIANRARVRIESAEPFFRGTKAALLFRASVASVDVEGVEASIELGGSLDGFELAEGRLRARVTLGHFSVVESAAGDLAADALDALLRAHLDSIQSAIPPVELPVQLERAIAVGGLTEGAVVARPGTLPIEMALSYVIISNGRLWALVDAQLGTWQVSAPEPRTELPPGETAGEIEPEVES